MSMLSSRRLFRVELCVPRGRARLVWPYFLTAQRALEHGDGLIAKERNPRAWATVRDFYPGELPHEIQELIELRGYRE